MRYVDTGWREANESLGSFIDSELEEAPHGLWIQSGFFSASALEDHTELIARLIANGSRVHLVLGGSGKSLCVPDLRDAFEMVGDSESTSLTVVLFAGALFHPKVYVFGRSDGTWCAYVGSANLTANGLDRNIEAGVILDARDGDPEEAILRARDSIERWVEAPEGPSVRHVRSLEAIDSMLQAGLIAEERQRGWGPAVSSKSKTPGDKAEERLAGLAALTSRRRSGKTDPRSGSTVRSTGDAPSVFYEAEDLDPFMFEILWIDAGSMSSSASHSQLELPRHGHQFFGFDFDQYDDDHHTVGSVNLRLMSRNEVYNRPLTWHGNNRMERLNLPTHAMGGPRYKDHLIVFRRGVDGEYVLEVHGYDADEARTIREASEVLGRVYKVGRGSDRLCGLADPRSQDSMEY